MISMSFVFFFFVFFLFSYFPFPSSLRCSPPSFPSSPSPAPSCSFFSSSPTHRDIRFAKIPNIRTLKRQKDYTLRTQIFHSLRCASRSITISLKCETVQTIDKLHVPNGQQLIATLRSEDKHCCQTKANRGCFANYRKTRDARMKIERLFFLLSLSFFS